MSRGVRVVDTNTLSWESGEEVLRTMADAWKANLGPAKEVASALKFYRQKSLFSDPASTRRFDLVELMPGYHDVTAAYHHTVEEVYYLDGSNQIEGEGVFQAGDYFWRPPGWVHRGISEVGATLLLTLEGNEPSEGSEYASRVISPRVQLGSNQLASADGPNDGPRNRVKRLESARMPWQPVTRALMQPEPDGREIQSAVKILSRNPYTGASTLLLRLEAGAESADLLPEAFDVQGFVLTGSLVLDGLNAPARSYLEIALGSRVAIRALSKATAYIKLINSKR
jgi:hypothetical protein